MSSYTIRICISIISPVRPLEMKAERVESSLSIMNIRLVPAAELTRHNEFPIPCSTPTATIDKLYSLCAADDLDAFQAAMNSETFDIVDLHDVMMLAIQHDRVEFVSILLFHGLPIDASYTQKATVCKAKGVLECLIKAGWDINEPVGTLTPPVLW